MNSFLILFKTVGYIADASAESARMAARSSALANSARRALWLKAWSGDAASKSRLCSLPIHGDLLFGHKFDLVLEYTADKKKLSPEVAKKPASKQFV